MTQSNVNNNDKLSKEHVDMILSGKRPEGMSFEQFKVVRKFFKCIKKRSR